jgi:tetratricopeptide (TPR) repeat protein
MRHAEKSEAPEALAEDHGRENGESHDPDANARVISACERLLEAGDLAAAKEELLLIDAMTPDNEADWSRLHAICLKLKDRTRAQLYTERFLKVCPDSATAHLANARNFMPNMGDWDRVRDELAAALGNPGSDAEFWREVARIQSAIRDRAAACMSARKAIALDPADAEIRELLILSLRVLRLRGEVRVESERLARCLQQYHPADPLRWASLARLAAETGPAARKQAKAYIDIAAGYLTKVNHGAEFELIRALIMTKQPARAMRYLQSLMAGKSQNSWLWTTLIDMATSRRYFEIALVAIAGLKAIPHLDSELLDRINLTEKRALKSVGRNLKGSVLRWIWPFSPRLR